MAENKINITGQLFASYGADAPIVAAEQVAYSETFDSDGNGHIDSSVKDEIDELKKQGTGSANSIETLKADIAKKANQEALDTTNTAVKKAQGDATAAATAAAEAKATANSKVASVGAGTAITVDSSTATAPVVNVKLAETQGNVKLDTANGLKASIDATEVAKVTAVNGVAANDNFLTLGADKLISAEASLKYVKVREATEKDPAKYEIQLIGKNNQVVSAIDASDFIKDGMVKSVDFNKDTKHLTITFNTDAGQDAIDVDLTKLVDTYKNGKGLTLATDGTFSIDETVVATKEWATGAFDTKGAATSVKTAVDAYTINGKALASANITLGGADITVGGESSQKDNTVDVAFKNLEDRVATAEGKAGVTSIGGQAGAISVKNGQTDNGSINLEVSTGKELSATIVGLKSAAYTEASAYDTSGSAAAVDVKLTEATASLSKMISDNATTAAQDVVDAKTEFQGKIDGVMGTGADDETPTVKRAEAIATTAKERAEEAFTKAGTAATEAIGDLGTQTETATAGQFVTGVTVTMGKLTSVASAAVKATQVVYGTDSNVGAALDSVKADVEAIKGTGTGSISDQITKKIADLDSTKDNSATATAAGTVNSTQVKVTVEQVDGKINSVAVVSPEFALPSEITSAVSAAKAELIGEAGTADTIKHAESLANTAQTTANEAKAAAEAASTTAASTYVKKAGDTMTGGLKMVAAEGGAGCTIKWNATDAALEFVFA